MKPSPIGSKILALYAILFAGLAPFALTITALVNGVVSPLVALSNLSLSAAIVCFGAQVFLGDYSKTKLFAILVAVNYLGLTLSNAWNMNAFPEDSRAAQMAISRMLRGVVFASIYIWYYLLRAQTARGFMPTSSNAPTLQRQAGGLDADMADWAQVSYRTLLLDDLEEYQAHLAELTRVIDLGQGNTHIYNNRGLAYLETGQVDHAKSDFETAVRLSADNAQARANLADLYAQQKRAERLPPDAENAH